MDARAKRLLERVPMLHVLAPSKSFRSPWIGSPRLNRGGLHPARIALSDACVWLRRTQLNGAARAPRLDALWRDGIVVIENFVRAKRHVKIQVELHRYIEAIAKKRPLVPGQAQGWGKRRPFKEGFDRYDGGTLNRLLTIDPRETPRTHKLVSAPRLQRLVVAASGARCGPEKFSIYQTLHGHEEFHDIQKDLHRDTFHSCIKAWYFVDEVTEEDGPFVYVPGSHRMNLPRYAWEYRCSLKASRGDARYVGGSFRVKPDDLAALGLPPARPYPVPANTLVIADVRGFHRRGDAELGRTRLALFASLRPWAFAPLPY